MIILQKCQFKQTDDPTRPRRGKEALLTGTPYKKRTKKMTIKFEITIRDERADSSDVTRRLERIESAVKKGLATMATAEQQAALAEKIGVLAETWAQELGLIRTEMEKGNAASTFDLGPAIERVDKLIEGIEGVIADPEGEPTPEPEPTP